MSKSRFELGDKVAITGQIVKQKSATKVTYVDAPVLVRGAWSHERDADGNTVTFESLRGRQVAKWQRNELPLDKGVIVGKRTLQDGDYWWEEFGAHYRPIRGATHQVWLVAVAMDRNPIYCRDEQVTKGHDDD